MPTLYPSRMKGYATYEDGIVLIPDSARTTPKPGNWRTRRATKVVDGEGKRVFNANGNPIRVPERGAAHQKQVEKLPMRGVRRAEYVSPANMHRVACDFPAVEVKGEKRERKSAFLIGANLSPNAEKKKSLIEVMVDAIEAGAMTLDDVRRTQKPGVVERIELLLGVR